MYAIEKNVPVPPRNAAINEKARKYPFPSMEVGDSFTTEDTKVRGAAYQWGTVNGGKKFSVRKQGDGSFRVWRIA